MAQPTPTGKITNIWIQDANGKFLVHYLLFTNWFMFIAHDLFLKEFVIVKCLPAGQPQMIKVVHATAGKGVPVSMASGAVRAVLRSNVSAI